MTRTVSAKQVTSMLHDVISFLIENELTDEVCIYANNHKFIFHGGVGFVPYSEFLRHVYVSHDKVDVTQWVEYSNPDIITMTFEGDLYSCINNNPDSPLMEKFGDIFAKYGCYYEQGYAWSLAVYPD